MRTLVGGLPGKSFIPGVTNNVNGVEFSLSGSYATLYRYELVGILLSHAFYVRGLFKLRGAHLWSICIVVAVFFFTVHTHGAFYIMYYIIISIDGHYTYDRKFLKRFTKTGGPWNGGWYI